MVAWVPKNFQDLYSLYWISPKKSLDSWFDLQWFNGRVFDLLNSEQQWIKSIFIPEFWIEFLYKLKIDPSSWIGDIIVFGTEYNENKESYLEDFSSKDIKTAQILPPNFIEEKKNYLHALICEHESLHPINIGMLFEKQEGWYSRYNISTSYQIIRTDHANEEWGTYLDSWEDAQLIVDMDESNQTFYIDESDPEVFTLSPSMSLHQNRIYIQDFPSQDLEIFSYEEIEYVYCLRETTLFFYWEIVEKEGKLMELYLLPNDVISSLWMDIIMSILATKWLWQAGIEVYFKRGWSDAFSPIEDISTDTVSPIKKEVTEVLPASLRNYFIHE